MNNALTGEVYDQMMSNIHRHLEQLDALEIPREDSAMGHPPSTETKIVCKHKQRNLTGISQQQMCSRAVHEYSLYQGV